MKLKQLINELQEIEEEHGNLEVHKALKKDIGWKYYTAGIHNNFMYFMAGAITVCIIYSVSF